MCSMLKKWFDDEGELFLEKIITCDETWIHHFEPESKRQSMVWKHPDSPSVKKFKSRPFANKVLLTVFWDMRRPIYCHYLEDRQTVNSESSSKELRDELRLAIREKRRGLIKRGVILQHNNVPPHAAHLTRGTLEELGWEVLIHPLYSPDLAPSDFHLFGPLKKFLRGKNFSSNNEVKIDVETWLRSQLKEFYAKAFMNLVSRWEK